MFVAPRFIRWMCRLQVFERLRNRKHVHDRCMLSGKGH